MDVIYKRIYKYGIAAYVFMLIESMLLYKERTVFIDIAYHLFYILKDGDFAIQNYRFGAVVTQIFPLLGSKLGLSLDNIARLYSAGFIIYYFTCYLLCGTVLKNYRMALVLLLCHTLFVTDTFYWAQSELPQGMAMMCVCFAYLQKRGNNKPGIIEGLFLTVAITAIAFIHPMLILPVTFMTLFFGYNAGGDERKKWIVVYLIYILALVVKAVFFSTTYDRGAMNGLKNFYYLFPDYFTIKSNKRLLQLFAEKYYWLPVLSIIITAWYLKRKEWQKAVLFVFFFLGGIMLVNVTDAFANMALFYLENLYLPVAVLVAIPFVYDTLPAIKHKTIGAVLFSLIVVTGLWRIYNNHELYTARLDWERKFLKENTDRKLIVDAADVPMDTLIMTWGTPYEFWLLSTIEYGRTASVVITDNTELFLWARNNKKAFVPTWGLYKYSELPGKYFKFTDTTSIYICR